jgi:hypothetical protein
MNIYEKIGKRLILFHEEKGADYIAFSLLAHKSVVEQALGESGEREIHEASFEPVASFLKIFPEYFFIKYGHFGGIYEQNVATFNYLLGLIQKFGWQKIDWEAKNESDNPS